MFNSSETKLFCPHVTKIFFALFSLFIFSFHSTFELILSILFIFFAVGNSFTGNELLYVFDGTFICTGPVPR